MKNICLTFLMFFTLADFNDVLAMDDVSEEDRLAIAMALSLDSAQTIPPRSPTMDDVSEEDHRLALAVALSQDSTPATIDFASEALARRMMVAEEARKKADDDAATADLIRRITLGEEAVACPVGAPAPMDDATATLIAAMLTADESIIHSHTVVHTVGGFHSDPTFHIVRTHKNIVTYRAMLKPIVTFLEGVAQGVDVHTLDDHVVGNIGKLHAIGDAFKVDNPALTIPEMHAYLLAHSNSYKGYEGQSVAKMQLAGYIDAALTRASEQASTLSMYSRVVSLLQRLGSKDQTMYLKRLFDAISENYLTQGGCFQGVRNRIYVRYVDMMNNLIGK